MFEACCTTGTLYNIDIVNYSWCQGSYFTTFFENKAPDPGKENFKP